jgi:[citrate (pro-3S)-lyase] ligase
VPPTGRGAHPRDMVTDLLTSVDAEQARTFLEAQGLAYEPAFEDLVGLFEGGELIAVGARDRDVLKMIAIDPGEQGGAVLGAVVTELARRGHAAGHEALFVFTRPASVPSFEALGFALLATDGRAALLEHGGGLARWLEASRGAVRDGVNGAVVVNCNPFTLGHRHLVEQAAAAVDTLYVFVVREDRSAFPFDVRLRLVREGTADLANVRVLDTSRYAVSAVTFPAYFLARAADAAAVQVELDLLVFGQRIAPFFGVRRRYFGAEPFCATTRAYNDAMRRVLPRLGVEAVELARLESRGAAISASSVREALRAGTLARAVELVPETTAAFLRSDAGRAVQARLQRGDGGRHA